MNGALGEEEWVAHHDLIETVKSEEDQSVMPMVGIRIVQFTREDGTQFFKALISGTPHLSGLLGLIELVKLDAADWFRYPTLTLFDQDEDEEFGEGEL